MTEAFVHLSVLAQEAPEALVHGSEGIYVDGTFGRGGHSRKILEKLGPNGRLIAFDRDPEAIKAARAITDPRFQIVHAPFSSMAQELQALGIEAVDGIFLDIGVSSPQIDDASRGFSFRFEGPLDMRMDTTRGITAQTWLATRSIDEMARVIREYGEERFAFAIAREIARVRELRPIETTKDLANLVANVVPKNKKDQNQHPATRTFQAIRIEINQELEELRSTLSQAGALLRPEGRLAVISFHSLEDRIVKQFFDSKAHPERQLDPRLPIRAEDLPQPWFTAIERIKPSREECERNARARSAILRVGTRTQTPWRDED